MSHRLRISVALALPVLLGASASRAQTAASPTLRAFDDATLDEDDDPKVERNEPIEIHRGRKPTAAPARSANASSASLLFDGVRYSVEAQPLAQGDRFGVRVSIAATVEDSAEHRLDRHPIKVSAFARDRSGRTVTSDVASNEASAGMVLKAKSASHFVRDVPARSADRRLLVSAGGDLRLVVEVRTFDPATHLLTEATLAAIHLTVSPDGVPLLELRSGASIPHV